MNASMVRSVPLGWWAATTAVIAFQAVSLAAMGQPVICTCGTVRLWVGTILGPDNSQHLFDWYTISHVIHGFLFYVLLWRIAPRLSLGARLAIAILLEATWELVENSPVVIDRYRETALAQGYSGDSVVNSVMDSFSAVAGFLLAARLPVRATVAVALAGEIFAGAMVRDNFTLNVLNLVYPFEAVQRWQAGGAAAVPSERESAKDKPSFR